MNVRNRKLNMAMPDSMSGYLSNSWASCI